MSDKKILGCDNISTDDLSTTKHPFDTLVHFDNDEVPFAMVFANNILCIYERKIDKKN